MSIKWVYVYWENQCNILAKNKQKFQYDLNYIILINICNYLKEECLKCLNK